MSAPSPVSRPAARPSPLRSTALRSTMLGIVSLSLGAVALLISWVPWVNLLGLVLALAGLVAGGIVAVMGRSLPRSLGIAGASLSVVALVGTTVLLGASAVGAVRERFSASEPSTPPAEAPEPEPTSPEPSGDAAPGEPLPSRPDAEGVSIDVGEQMDLDGCTGMVDQLSVNASWGPGVGADSGAEPESASVAYRLALTDGSGSAPSLDAGDAVEVTVMDEGFNPLAPGPCIDTVGDSSFNEPPPPGSLISEECIDLPTDYDGQIGHLIETPDVVGSPIYVIDATVSIAHLGKNEEGKTGPADRRES